MEVALDEALNAGYRHIDTAYMYENEHVIGNVLKKWFDSGKIKRDELFIVTKVSVLHHHNQGAVHILRHNTYTPPPGKPKKN